MAARKKQHPHIGKFRARYEYESNSPENEPEVFTSADEAATDIALDMDDGDVIYVYQIVAVKKIVDKRLLEDLA